MSNKKRAEWREKYGGVWDDNVEKKQMTRRKICDTLTAQASNGWQATAGKQRLASNGWQATAGLSI